MKMAECQVTDGTDLGFGAKVVCRTDGSCAVHWRSCKSDRQGVGSGEGEVIMCV